MTYLVVKSLHLIFMVTWMAGLFYLPRLFVYHAQAADRISIERHPAGRTTGRRGHSAGGSGPIRMPGSPYMRVIRNPPRLAKNGPDRGLSG